MSKDIFQDFLKYLIFKCEKFVVQGRFICMCVCVFNAIQCSWWVWSLHIVKVGVQQEQREEHKQGDQHSRPPLGLPAHPPLEILTFFAHCMCHSGIIAIGSSGPLAPLAPDASSSQKGLRAELQKRADRAN